MPDPEADELERGAGLSTFDEPQRIAVQHEVFDDQGDIDESQWVEQRDVVQAGRVDFGNEVVTFENTTTEDVFIVSTDNFISAWTEDYHA